MDVNENQVLPAACPKCNSVKLEKIDSSEGAQGFFGFYGRGNLEKDFVCKECEHTW